MRQSWESLWNLICISKRQAHCTLCLLPCFSISSLLQPSILFSFTLLICISRFTSLPLTQLHLHLIYTFWWLSSGLSFVHRSNYCFSLLDMCMYDERQRSWVGTGSKFCSTSANRTLKRCGFMKNDLLPGIEPFSSKYPQRFGYGSNNENKPSFATHTCLHVEL